MPLWWDAIRVRFGDQDMLEEAIDSLDRRKAPGSARLLFAALSRAKSYGARVAAENALANCGVAALPALIRALDSSSASLRRSAAEVLGRIGSADAIPALVRHLDTLGRPAALALKSLSWSPADPVDEARLALGLGDGDALARLAPRCAAFLGDVLRRRSGEEGSLGRAAAARALGKCGDLTLTSHLIEALRDETDYVRAAAAESLKALGWKASTAEEQLSWATAAGDVGALVELGRPAVPALCELLRHNPSRPAEVTHHLAMLGGSEAMAALRTALSQNPTTQKAAVEGLLESPHPEAGDVLLEAVEKPGIDRRETLLAMAKHAGIPLSAAVRAFRGKNEDTRRAAAHALVEVGWQPETVEEQLGLLLDAGRWGDVVALGERAATPLMAHFTQAASGVRRRIAEAAGAGGGQWSRGLLQAALHDDVYAVRKAGAAGLHALDVAAQGKAGSEALEVGPTPGACARCGERLIAGGGPVSLGFKAGLAGPGTLEAAFEPLLKAAYRCTSCGLSICYPCAEFGKEPCVDCGGQAFVRG